MSRSLVKAIFIPSALFTDKYRGWIDWASVPCTIIIQFGVWMGRGGKENILQKLFTGNGDVRSMMASVINHKHANFLSTRTIQLSSHCAFQCIRFNKSPKLHVQIINNFFNTAYYVIGTYKLKIMLFNDKPHDSSRIRNEMPGQLISTTLLSLFICYKLTKGSMKTRRLHNLLALDTLSVSCSHKT